MHGGRKDPYEASSESFEYEARIMDDLKGMADLSRLSEQELRKTAQMLFRGYEQLRELTERKKRSKVLDILGPIPEADFKDFIVVTSESGHPRAVHEAESDKVHIHKLRHDLR